MRDRKTSGGCQFAAADPCEGVTGFGGVAGSEDCM